MKRSLNFSMLLLAISVITQPIFARYDVDLSAQSRKLCCKDKYTCKSFIKITEHDINEASRNSTDGLVLDKPGNYKLCENVNWTVRTPNSQAITIAADNVSLDLDGHTIKQLDTTQSANFAINVLGTTSYTLIHNGILQQISGGGILVDAGANCITIDTIECNRCCYNGETTLAETPIADINSWAAAIFINATSDNKAHDITITNCTFCDNGIIGMAPVWFTGTISGGTTLTLTEEPLYPITPGFVLSSAGTTLGTIVSQVSPTEYIISPASDVGPVAMTVTDPNGAFIPFGFVSFVYTGYATQVTMENCIGNGNFGYLLSWGLTFTLCTHLNVSNIIINNPVTFVLAKGMELLACDNAIIEDISISNIIMNFTPDANAFPIGHGAEGIKCGSSTDCVFRRITFSGNRIQTQVPTAFTSPRAYADCCGLFCDVLAGLGPLSNIVVEDCTAVDMVNDGGRFAGNVAYTAGFHSSTAILLIPPVAEEIKNIQYARCWASGLIAQVGWAYGFGSVPEPSFLSIDKDISYTDCSTEDITIFDAGIYAAGYVLTAERNIVNNCTANRIIDERENPSAYGVILDDLTDGQIARSCIVAGNKLTNCSTTAILDNGLAATNIINSNYAALNGPLGAGPNYVGLSASNAALKQDWPLAGVPAAPPVGGPVLANVDVHN